jgi:hypothetical protein
MRLRQFGGPLLALTKWHVCLDLGNQLCLLFDENYATNIEQMTLRGDDIAVLVQPLPSAHQQFIGVGCCTTSLPQVGYQLASYGLSQILETELGLSQLLMLVQRRAPPIKRPQ